MGRFLFLDRRRPPISRALNRNWLKNRTFFNEFGPRRTNGRDGGFAPIGDRFADHARLGIMLRENRCALLSADRLLERGVEFSLLTDTFEDSGATFVQLAQIPQLDTSAR